MKINDSFTKRAALLLALLSTLNPQLSTFAQGILTPPGAPAPTMKTLAQIEPRTPISSAPFTISQPGSYYLTTNLTVITGDAIEINTNGVTLDLNGFTITSTAASATGAGIFLAGGTKNITIANGFIQGGVTNNAGTYSGSGFANGINFSGNFDTGPANVLVSRVSVSGCLLGGIDLPVNGRTTVVESCTVQTVGGAGVYASIVKSTSAIDCGIDGIHGDLVSDCVGRSYTGDAITALATAQDCYGTSSSGYGIDATIAQNCYGTSSSLVGVTATIAQNCRGESVNGDGLDATDTAVGCYGSSGSGYGLHAKNAQNCSGYSDSSDGVHADAIAIGCYGYNYSGSGYDGLYCGVIAIGCYGYSSAGTGLGAFTAEVCHGDTTSGTAFAVTHNVNSF